MSTHLAPRHFVEAIDGTLAPAEEHHLRECATCQAELERVRAVLREVEGAAPLPEPSPLFWDHFGYRVCQATAGMPVERPTWWASWWRPVALAGASLAVVTVAVFVRPAPTSGPDAAPLAQALPWPSLDGDEWNLVVSLAEDLEWEDVQKVAAPNTGVADALIDELSAAERAAFVKLLKQEMGGFE